MIESPFRIEPCLFDGGVPPLLADLAVEIQRESAALGQGLHPDSAGELADLVRMTNCYYSNLIEGHNTRPKDIELALNNLPVEPERRPLALEARAHVLVQRGIDRQARDGALPEPASVDFIRTVHREFYLDMPAEFRVIEQNGRAILPGAFRTAADEDVAVGRHIPPSSGAVVDFMTYFENRFRLAGKGAGQRILAIPAAHHRLNYIHPFPDGNGRVSRLMSHAMAQAVGIGARGLWSVSRGLARGLTERSEYKRMMDHADMPRQGDLDGRDNLSARALGDFTEWFLLVVLDQLRFSSALFDLGTLEARYRALLKDVGVDKRAPDLVAAVLRQGNLHRGDAALVLKTSERTARNTVSALVKDGYLSSASPKAPLRVAFPLDYRERLFPNLFGEGTFTVPPSPVRTSE